MKKTPKLIDLPKMRNILETSGNKLGETFYIDSQFAVMFGFQRIFKLILSQEPPFVINDYRLGIIVKGELSANINLQDKHFEAGTLMFVGPGTILNPISISEDLEVWGTGFSPDFPLPFAEGQMPAAFNSQARDFQVAADEKDIEIAKKILETLWALVQKKDFDRQTAGCIIAALMCHYNDAFFRLSETQDINSRAQSIFDRFIQLVNRHAATEHKISFYASKMCLTERYLGTTVRQSSGVTAKEWIDRALITFIKIQLRHTDKPINQISDEMIFPNTSFFCKYFKRLTGSTPAEFREGGGR